MAKGRRWPLCILCGFFLVFFPKAKGWRPRRKGVAGQFFLGATRGKEGGGGCSVAQFRLGCFLFICFPSNFLRPHACAFFPVNEFFSPFSISLQHSIYRRNIPRFPNQSPSFFFFFVILIFLIFLVFFKASNINVDSKISDCKINALKVERV